MLSVISEIRRVGKGEFIHKSKNKIYMFKQLPCYTIICDGCNKNAFEESENAGYSSKEEAFSMAEYWNEFVEHEGKHYCYDCAKKFVNVNDEGVDGVADDIVYDDGDIVRKNLMSIEGYTPYCGNPLPLMFGGGCRSPRTEFNGSQFFCGYCGWESQFEKEFIDRYKQKWNK